MDSQHILLLGATAATGHAFITHHLTLSPSSRPYLTLYIRPTSAHKLALPLQDPSNLPPKLRIVAGALTSHAALTTALSASPTAPQATTVISFLGAYIRLPPLITRFVRSPSTPIADAVREVVMPAMKECGVTRIMALSTPSGVNSVQEVRSMKWKWWLYTWLPTVAVPEANAEMREIARVVSGGALGAGMTRKLEEAAKRGGGEGEVQWTVFRVPGLVGGQTGGTELVRAGMFGEGFNAGLTLTRESLVRWVMEEVEERRWIGSWPMLANA